MCVYIYDTSSHHSSQGVCKGAVYERPVSMAAIAYLKQDEVSIPKLPSTLSSSLPHV